MLFKSFLYGILAALGALVVELGILSFFFDSYFSGANAGYSTSVSFLLVAAILEEISKALFVFKLNAQENNVLKPYLAAMLVGLGFFAAEFALKQPLFSNGSIIQSTGVLFVHVFTTFILGYALWKAPRKRTALIAMTALNIALHFGYNILVLSYS
ncbi:MAG: PrsW family intramembrane metalloprotease [Candidatus Moranbacteria bacterium]|nr:PrsW family intramembrane metalloprotease [Candidatus Moranbacteria bacterium]